MGLGVKERVEQSFRRALETTPYKKITVAQLCADAGIARKTFYAHFSEKEGIIDFVFRRDVIAPQFQLRELLPRSVAVDNPKMFNVKLYECILADRDFYYRIVSPLRGVDDTFLRVVTWAIYDYNLAIMKDRLATTDPWIIDYTAYFFASSQALFTQKWISEGMVVSPEDLGDLYAKFTLGFWRTWEGE